EELPIQKPSSGGTNSISISMGNNYANQVFFSLSKQEIIAQNNREIWDLAFDSSEEGFHVHLNGAKRMGAKKANTNLFSAVQHTNNEDWHWDRPSGDLDSTAIGDWRGNDTVILIDRGVSLSGLNIGFYKIKVTDV